MTTNKPEVLGFFSEHKQADGGFRLSTDHFETRPDAVRFAFIDVRAVPVIRLSDYEALQAELETVKKVAYGNIELLERNEALQAECERWKRGSEIRDEQNQDLHSFVMELKAECEKLRKDAKRYVPLNEAVQRAAAELPEGWEIQLCAVRDSGWVDLIGPDGAEDFDTDNERLDYTVIDALEFAIDAAMQGATHDNQ